MNRTLLAGMLAGAAGTAAMTVAMRLIAPRMLPRDMLPEEFLPRRVVQGMAARLSGSDRVGARSNPLGGRTAMAVAIPAHIAYGTLNGLLYTLARRRRPLRRLSTLRAGAAFGALVWAISYEGWLPAAGILGRTTEQPPRRWIVPIGSHLVYGTATAVAHRLLRGDGDDAAPGVQAEMVAFEPG